MSETSTPAPESAPLVWIDCEMTGLHPQVDELVEVAVLITDAELNILDEGIDLVIRPSEAALEQMDPFVRDMHTTSGLLPELEHGLTLENATARVMEYLTARVPAGKALCTEGNTGLDGMKPHLHFQINAPNGGAPIDPRPILEANGVAALVNAGLLPLVSLLIEPAKVFFLNNAINHGVLTPLGTTEVAVIALALSVLNFRLFRQGAGEEA